MTTNRAVPAFFLALILAGVSACSSDGSGTKSRDTGLDALSTDAVAVADAEDVFASLQDATLDQAMTMGAVATGLSFHRNDGHPRPPGSHLGAILRALEINREQLGPILDAVMAHWRRVERALRGLREVNESIIAASNRARQEIIQAFQSGEITREEAERRLHRLNERTHEAIRNNPANEPFLRAICESRRMLFREVRSVLDPRQQGLWDRWVASLDDPCLHD